MLPASRELRSETIIHIVLVIGAMLLCAACFDFHMTRPIVTAIISQSLPNKACCIQTDLNESLRLDDFGQSMHSLFNELDSSMSTLLMAIARYKSMRDRLSRISKRMDKCQARS